MFEGSSKIEKKRKLQLKNFSIPNRAESKGKSWREPTKNFEIAPSILKKLLNKIFIDQCV